MRNDLTELEECVIGVVWRDGPMTAYEIASLFAKSLSPYWSGSAGAIYPAAKRLQTRGLLRGERKAWNGVRKTVLTVTPKGVRALRSWLSPPLPPGAAAPSFDSIRTRMLFSDLLPPGQRLQLINDARRVTADQIKKMEQRRREDIADGQAAEAWAHLGVIYEMKGRLRWLRKMATSVEEERR